MSNFFEFMAPKGVNPFADYASRFGITQDQATRAMVAMMPAFAMAMQRRAPTPSDFAQMFMPQTGRSMDPMQAFFGSRDLADRIAEQTAGFAGLNSSIIQQMMPAMAGALATALTKAAGESPFAKAHAAAEKRTRDAAGTRAAEESGAALGGMFAAMMGLSPPAPEPEPEPEPEKSAAELNVDALAEMMHTSRQAQEEHLRNLQSIFTTMMGGGR